jgi:hypothetical protein
MVPLLVPADMAPKLDGRLSVAQRERVQRGVSTEEGTHRSQPPYGTISSKSVALLRAEIRETKSTVATN